MASSAVILLLFLSAAVVTFANSSWRSDNEVRQLHKEWMIENSRSYSTPEEEESRFKIFKDNLHYIDEHNAAANHGEHTFWLGLTPFADLTNREYRARHLGLRIPDLAAAAVASNRYLPLATDNLPSSVDWRQKGAVAPIKNQLSCGSCWAFSAISTVESINDIVTGKLITLSEQQLVDCDKTDQGCNGGWMDNAFNYIIKNGGIATDKTYPYVPKQQQCKNPTEKAVTINSYEDVPTNSELAMKKAVANQPISVAIEASGQDFQLYKSGIFVGKCTTNLDHGVVVVGYGTQNGKDFWIVRNSWGTGWGEAGYIRMERNIKAPQGKCGIAMYPSYPIKLKNLFVSTSERDDESSSA